MRYSVLSENFSDNDRSITDNAMDGKMKIFIAKGKVLGGTMVGENAGELVQELILAQSSGLHIKHIFGKIYPYPTASRINKQAISRLFAGKLTNINKALLKLLYH
ncbi:MAG: hypothetical protein COW88_01160 [Candidatus Lloydbacteria bacterium CG22_combo_CG10-13_8_21_14_all_47_15]|uniref:Pyridine nucleotide-disulphide oxidoreductase dimerisation domain-containing protein n=1 Tax=Candidatus Lloydbacteria bacterium CG22_combo_CG10-13_8_21_14_all_47_15 TaxID=1974635 RepID=A0A2H0CUV9_9BACT|nr:MAG: hypothetical protein COW88_01160 [Candidatus Lloydbacteria bacterium CG22_combo_CG10-13_8_21_14_all_47_15]